MLKFLTSLFLLLTALPVHAQNVSNCDTWLASARHIPEPWSDYSRVFANGEIRVTLLDTRGAAIGPVYLMVIAPPRNEMSERNCWIITESDGTTGFGDIDFLQLSTSYDAATGLTLRFPAKRYIMSDERFAPAILAVTINQATGEVTPRFEIP